MDLPKLPGVLFPPTMPLELTGAWLDNNWMCSNWLLSFLCDYYWVTFHCHRKLSPPPKALQTRSARHPTLRFPAAFPASERRLVQTDDLQIHLFSTRLLGLLGHGTTFPCRDLACVKIHSWCLLSAVFQQLAHPALLCSRVGLSLYSATHCTYLRETLSSHLSAAHSHHRMHVLYSTYPICGRSPIVFLGLFA